MLRRIVRRPLAPAETDYELIIPSVTLTAFALVATWFVVGLAWPRCVFHELTGLPCLTCGATRSVIAFLHGNFLSALKWNPLVFTIICTTVVFNCYALAVLALRMPRFRIVNVSSLEKKIIRALIVTAILANWIYLLIHWRNF